MNKNKDNNIILGAGIAGLGAAYSLRKKGEDSVLIEKDASYGGLCGGFEIDGFRFDRFVHLSFSKNKDVNEVFNAGATEVNVHIPNPYNYYSGKWIKHPAQNNLYPLPDEEKQEIIEGFINRPDVNQESIKNYHDWLVTQFGDAFALKFPAVYTKKYWMRDARELETKWVGERVYQPSTDEVIRGSQTDNTPVAYYAKEMRYPKKGGFKQFLSLLAKDANIKYNEEVRFIDPHRKIVTTNSGIYHYKRLISSLPLPAVIDMINDVPEDVVAASKRLCTTSGYQVSVGLKTKRIPPYLWWYIYDEDILPARVYSPSLKSADNAPDGCSSLQLEIYCEKDKYTEQELIDGSVGKLIERGILHKEDILFVDVRFEQYANVIFDHNIYESRKTLRDYLSSVGIETIGRFGEWDYLWSDQSLLSGLNIR